MPSSLLRLFASARWLARACADLPLAGCHPSAFSRLAILSVSLASTATLDARISLSWRDNSDNEKGFAIERSDNNSGFVEIARVGANRTSFFDPAAKGGRKYSYRIRAYNRFGYSGYSNVSAKALPLEKPDPATTLSKTAVTQKRSEALGPKPSIIKDATYDSVTLVTEGEGYERYADRLSFNYLPGHGDFRLVIQVTHFKPDGPAARAGLMIRSSLDPNDAQASLVLNGEQQLEWLYREQWGEQTRIKSYRQTLTNPYFCMEKIGRKLYLRYSEDGRRWKTLVGLFKAFEEDFLIGIALGADLEGNKAEAKFTIVESDGIDASLFGLPPLKTPVPSKLVGEHANPGGYTYFEDSGIHTLEATGNGFGESDDSLRYAFSESDGNASITLRVLAVASTDPHSQASLVFRQGLETDDAYAAVTVDRDANVSASWRTRGGARAASTASEDIETASILKIERIGSTFTLLASDDGFNWTQLSRTNLSLQTPYLAGFSLSSSNNRSLAAGAFEILESNVAFLRPSHVAFGTQPFVEKVGTDTAHAFYDYEADLGIHIFDSQGHGFESDGDALTFPNWENEGPARIAAKLHEFSPDGRDARLGLMIRASNAPRSQFASITINGNGQVEALWRSENGGPISSRRSRKLPEGSYIALEKADGKVTFSYSTDGANWSELTQQTLAFPRYYELGPVLGSHDGYSIGALEITGLY